METIRIETPYNKEDFIRVYKIQLKIQRIKSNKQIRGIVITSLVLFGLGLASRTADEPENPVLFIGSILLFVTIWILIFTTFTRKQTSAKIIQLAEKFDRIKMDCTYEITDDSVKYWDKEKHMDLKWSVFTSYSIYKDFLILTINDSLIHSYIFEKCEPNIENYNKILELVKTKLEYREIT